MKKFLLLSMLLCMVVATAFAQTRKISGRVTDDKSGNPIMGASIMESGTSHGTTTNQDGKFTLTIPQGKVN